MKHWFNRDTICAILATMCVSQATSIEKLLGILCLERPPVDGFFYRTVRFSNSQLAVVGGIRGLTGYIL